MVIVNTDAVVQSGADNLWVHAVWMCHIGGLTQNSVRQRFKNNYLMVVRWLANAKCRCEVR